MYHLFLAVDIDYNAEDEDYTGHVKGAVSSLLNDLFRFWPLSAMPPEQLIPAADDEVGFSASSPY
jgi:hypothetical protein